MTPLRFYVLEYNWADEGLPAFISGEFNHPEFEWDYFNPTSFSQANIKNSYEFRITDKSITTIDFDFYDPRAPIVSDAFLAVCGELGVNYKAVPLSIYFSNGERSLRSFHLLLALQSASLLDRISSTFLEDKITESGQVAMDKAFPTHPVYSWIKDFRITPTDMHLFHCIEIFHLCASSEFKERSEARNLKGLGFVPIDSTYRYDPWGELNA